MNIKDRKNNKGFTLIEMLVAVAIFSIVLVIALGAILTIFDANKKAQTLTSVMNNLNFAVESMTRSIKTGVDPVLNGATNTITVDGIDLAALDFSRQKVNFRFLTDSSSGEEMGYIGRCIGTCANDEDYIPITAPEVDIDNFVVKSYGYSDAGEQPRTFLFLDGKVVFSTKIQSSFSIQTTISQRRLDVAGEESSI